MNHTKPLSLVSLRFAPPLPPNRNNTKSVRSVVCILSRPPPVRQSVLSLPTDDGLNEAAHGCGAHDVRDGELSLRLHSKLLAERQGRQDAGEEDVRRRGEDIGELHAGPPVVKVPRSTSSDVLGDASTDGDAAPNLLLILVVPRRQVVRRRHLVIYSLEEGGVRVRARVCVGESECVARGVSQSHECGVRLGALYAQPRCFTLRARSM